MLVDGSVIKNYMTIDQARSRSDVVGVNTIGSPGGPHLKNELQNVQKNNYIVNKQP